MTKADLVNYYDQRAGHFAGWGRQHRYYHRQIEDLLNFLIPVDASLVDVGCGAGDLLSVIHAKAKLGIDWSPKMLERARSRHPDIEFLEDNAEDLKIHKRFDYVLMSELVGSLTDIERALQQMQLLINLSGRLVIVSHNYLWQPILTLAEVLGLKAHPPLQSWLTPVDLENLLYLAGFEVIKSGRRVLCPVYIPVLSWFLNCIIVRLPLFSRLGLVHYVVARSLPVEKNELSVSVIIPARNEKGNIERIVKRMPHFPSDSEIIFVEGHSVDGTFEEIQRIANLYKGKRNITIARQDGRGKGDAVRKGFSIAKGELLMILDADMTVAPADLTKFYQAIRNRRGDFINGSRLIYPMEKEAMRFLNNLGNKFFAAVFSWLLSQRLKDTLCGTKVLFRTDYQRIAANRSYFGEFDPFGDFDLIFGATKLNLKIIDLPIRYKERAYGTTQIKRFSHGWLLLKMCVFAARKLKFNS